MRRRRTLTFSALFLLLLASMPVMAQPESADTLPPLGIAMEEYPYPFPVQFLPLKVEGQAVRMAYMDVPATGTANGRTVVLLHGKNFYGAYWENTIRILTGAGYRVVVPDQLGFGKSSKPDMAYSFDLLTANTAALLDTLKVSRTVVVGHSMGGMLAVRFTRNYPERVEQLILENPIGLEDYRFKIPPQTLEQAIEGERKQTPEAYRAYVKSYFVTYPASEYEKFVTVRTRITKSGEFERWVTAAGRTYLMIYQQPVRHEFRLITAPTLLIIGQADRTTIGRNLVSPEVVKTLGQYPELGKAAAADIPNAKLFPIENVGHIPHLEAPDVFHKALLDFLQKR